jgi:hypothetical protein
LGRILLQQPLCRCNGYAARYPELIEQKYDLGILPGVRPDACTPNGRQRVSDRRYPSRSVPCFTMCWTEREGPPVSAPKQCGFGTIVMEAMTERSIGGAVDLDYASSGLTWRLTCPAANALEPEA